MKTSLAVMLFLASSVEAKHHHHHDKQLVSSDEELQDMESLNAMSTNKLVAGLRSTLDSALAAEARDDKAAAVANTAAIKNIQKALTARILKRLDDGQPLVEVARKMKAIEGMQP
jgi:heme oxygenase